MGKRYLFPSRLVPFTVGPLLVCAGIEMWRGESTGAADCFYLIGMILILRGFAVKVKK